MSLVHPDDQAQEMQSVIERALRDHEAIRRRRTRSSQPGGDIRYPAKPRPGRAGRQPANRCAWSGVCQDVTERKRAEEERQESEVALSRAVRVCAPDGIVIADSQSRYIDANPSICRMLGYTRDELIGLHASDIVAPTEIPHIGSGARPHQSPIRLPPAVEVAAEGRLVRRGEVMAIVMPDGNLLGMIRDITDRKVAEARIRAPESGVRRPE